MGNEDKAGQFQSWQAGMGAAVAAFVESLPPADRAGLDGTPRSLDVLEAWLLRRYAHVDQTRPGSEAQVLDGAARYLGEVLRQATGSSWSIELANERDAFFGLPVLKGGRLQAALCPLTTVTAATSRRSGSFFSTILRNVAA